MISDRKKAIFELSSEIGNEATAKRLNLTESTIRRANRAVREHYRSIGQPILRPVVDGPKILSFDIETSPIKTWVWRFGQQYLGPNMMIDDWFVISWAAKWLMSAETFSDCNTPAEMLAKDDKRVMESMWKLLDEADIVIAHNGIKFDVRKVNARFIQNGINMPPSSYQVVDTLKEARRHFGFSSNTQDFLTKMLKLPLKIKTDFDLWARCMAGDQEALFEMERYNQGDVNGLEEIYLKILPWMKSHPNVGLYYHDGSDVSRCPKCGNVHLDWKGEYRTPAGKYNEFRCGSCKTIGRSRHSNMTIEERKVLTVSTAR